MITDFDQALNDALGLIANQHEFVRGVFSGRRRNMSPLYEKVELRAVKVKDVLKLQVIRLADNSSKTSYVDFIDNDLRKIFESGFANLLVETKSQAMTIRITKKGDAQVHLGQLEQTQSTTHDKQKVRLLDQNDPFLFEVGITDSKGQIKPTKHDKYLQVDEFLRILVPTLDNAIAAGQISKPDDNDPLTLVDLGCGNAYLTFAAHQFLNSNQKPVRVVGVDQRNQSLVRNTDIAQRLGITETISFQASQISQTDIKPADVTIALHACDTATDDAIAWAVNNQTKLLLVAPCCHHQLQTQMVNSPASWELITKHGILKERLGDLLTDSLRAQLLRLVGYRTDIIEFIGDSHTPRNLMIRAVRTGAIPPDAEFANYRQLCQLWQIEPKLGQLLNISSH